MKIKLLTKHGIYLFSFLILLGHLSDVFFPVKDLSSFFKGLILPLIVVFSWYFVFCKKLEYKDKYK